MVPVDAQAANYGHFAMPFGAISIVAARRGTDRAALVAGLALAIATLTRQTWAIGVFPAAFAIYRYGNWKRHLPIAFIGGVLPILLLAATVRWDDFYYWAVQSNGGFVVGEAQITTIALRGISAAVIFGALHFVTVRFAFAGGREALLRNLDLWIWVVTVSSRLVRASVLRPLLAPDRAASCASGRGGAQSSA